MFAGSNDISLFLLYDPKCIPIFIVFLFLLVILLSLLSLIVDLTRCFVI